MKSGTRYGIVHLHQLSSVQNLRWLMMSFGTKLIILTTYIGDYEKNVEFK